MLLSAEPLPTAERYMHLALGPAKQTKAKVTKPSCNHQMQTVLDQRAFAFMKRTPGVLQLGLAAVFKSSAFIQVEDIQHMHV